MSSPGEAQTRVAVVSPLESHLVAQLATMAHPLVVRRFRDLYADATAICRFEATALFLIEPDLGDEEAGALRMISALLPELSVVIVSEEHREVEHRRIADRIGALILVRPFSQGQLADVLDRALRIPPGPTAAALLDLARGISDEVNNPLMFIGGHLQLLERSLEADGDDDALEHVRNLQAGLERIRRTMEKVRLLAQAGDAAGARGLVNLNDLARDAVERLPEQPTITFVACADPMAAEVVGDAQLLESMIEHLVDVAGALPATAAPAAEQAAQLTIVPGATSVVLRATVDARDLPAWQLPRTFDPYYLTRILRDTPHGLSLYLVQVIAQNHGGFAVSRWTQAGELALEVELPRGHSSPPT